MSSWDTQKEKKLRELWKKGHSGSEIAKMLGDTTRNAVIGCLAALIHFRAAQVLKPS